MTPQDCFTTLEQYIDTQKESIAVLQADLTRLHEEIADVKTDRDKAKDELLAFSKTCRKETDKLEESLQVLKKEEARLSQELGILVNRKGELQVANAKLEATNKEFMLYESKAWQSLNAKDTELQAREKKLIEKESLRPMGKSFLPPTQ